MDEDVKVSVCMSGTDLIHLLQHIKHLNHLYLLVHKTLNRADTFFYQK